MASSPLPLKLATEPAAVPAAVPAAGPSAKAPAELARGSSRGAVWGVAPRVQHKYHAFLSHDWGTDSEGRSNHERVIRICHALREAGLTIWLDEDEMRGDVNEKVRCA